MVYRCGGCGGVPLLMCCGVGVLLVCSFVLQMVVNEDNKRL